MNVVLKVQRWFRRFKLRKSINAAIKRKKEKIESILRFPDEDKNSNESLRNTLFLRQTVSIKSDLSP